VSGVERGGGVEQRGGSRGSGGGGAERGRGRCQLALCVDEDLMQTAIIDPT
jgi:hypothetical protein